MGVVAGRRGYSWLRSVGRGRWPPGPGYGCSWPVPCRRCAGTVGLDVEHVHTDNSGLRTGAGIEIPPAPAVARFSCLAARMRFSRGRRRRPDGVQRPLLRPRPPPSSSPPPTPGTVQAKYERSRLGWSTPAVRGARLRRGHPNPVPDGQAGTAGVPAALRLPASPASSTAPPSSAAPGAAAGPARSGPGARRPRASCTLRALSRVCRLTAESRPAGVVAECVEQVGQSRVWTRSCLGPPSSLRRLACGACRRTRPARAARCRTSVSRRLVAMCCAASHSSSSIRTVC